MGIMKFYVTFGQKSPFRNGWTEVEATSFIQALDLVSYALGNEYSKIYGETEFNEIRRNFPHLKIGEIIK